MGYRRNARALDHARKIGFTAWSRHSSSRQQTLAKGGKRPILLVDLPFKRPVV
jgi:hypothetical protein